MKKVSLWFIVISLLSTMAYSYTITHNDYSSGGTISASGQNTNENAIVNVINGNLDANNIAAGAISGSTANSGGSQGKILQGTISTPDFRTNAVTVSSGSTNGICNNSVAGAGGCTIITSTITTTTITTIGKPVLIIATLNWSFGTNANAMGIRIQRGNTYLQGGFCDDSAPSGGSTTLSCTVTTIDTPAAGTYTYSLGGYTSGSPNSAPYSYSLVVIELRT